MSELNYPYGRLRICPTMRCNFACGYCSLYHYQEDICRIKEYAKEEVSPDVWIKNLGRVVATRPTMSVVFGTGEPGMYEGVSDIVNSLRAATFYYTNLSTLGMNEIRKMHHREGLYLYASYHKCGITKEEFVENALEVQSKFKIVNFHAVRAPEFVDVLEADKQYMATRGIELDISHPFLVQREGQYGFYGKWGEHPKFKNCFASRCFGVPKRTVLCKTSFNHHPGCNTMAYPVAPNGDIYVCWRYMLAKDERGRLGNFFDEGFQFNDAPFLCHEYGDCNMCHWDRNIVDAETGEMLDSDVVDWKWL